MIDNASIRVLERESITAFVSRMVELHRDPNRKQSLLDYGCGKQPYRQIIEEQGWTYFGYDREVYPANVSGRDIGGDRPLTLDWDAVLCNQMIQYVKPWDVGRLLAEFRSALFPKRGVLLMTGPTTWPLVEPDDICRYTPNGMRQMLLAANFRDVQVEIRASVEAGSVGLAIGWWAVART